MTNLATATECNSNLLLQASGIPHCNVLSPTGSTLLYPISQTSQAGASAQKTANMGLGGHLANPSGIFTTGQSRAIQILALSFATLSLFSTIITIYWFYMMRRNFRRQLILLLIIGDFFKSTWYVVFATTAISVHGIKTKSDFCQANGFLLQASVEACDFAILFMSMHMYLQMFSATSKLFGRDGLYRFRHTVRGLYILLPLLSASLAFIHGETGYISQGPFCTLPIRPYWYRLALTWIPRYLIWAYIMFVALCIYLHVGRGFKVFARQDDRISTGSIVPYSEDVNTNNELRITKKKSAPNSLESDDPIDGSTAHSSPDAFAPAMDQAERRPSTINWNISFVQQPGTEGPGSLAGSRRGSRVAFQPEATAQVDTLQIPFEPKRHRGSISTLSSIRSNGDMSVDGNRPPTLAPIEEVGADGPEETPQASADTPLKARRRAIQRQLRLLFIYPMVYMIMWTIPFIYHSLNYTNHYAQHPSFPLACMATMCQCALGFVDCLVFGWREKPWKHVPHSDGTFLGSFMFWRFWGERSMSWSTPAPSKIPGDLEAGGAMPEGSRNSQSYSVHRSFSHASVRPHKKPFSGSSDRKTMAAEQAQERLALERADREMRSQPQTPNGSLYMSQRPPMEWWERRLSYAVLDSPTEETQAPHLP